MESPFNSTIYLRKFVTFKMFDKLRKPVDRSHEWPMGPAVVNAAYQPDQNSISQLRNKKNNEIFLTVIILSIAIPAGILQLVFFNESRPHYLNYGSIGSVVGHEITHGFDDQGSQYDENGNLNDWWSNKTQIEFDKRAKCFVDQYGAIKDDQIDMNLNGVNTLGENIADNGGLRGAYDAYHNKVTRKVDDGILPGFENFTLNQLFFVSYANVST